MKYNRKDLDYAIREVLRMQQLGYRVTLEFKPHSLMVMCRIEWGEYQGGSISPDLIDAIHIAADHMSEKLQAEEVGDE